MPLKTTFNVPPWNKRRWILFKKYINQPTVIETRVRYQREFLNSGVVPLWAYGDIVDNYLPDGCSDAYSAFLNTPGISEQEMADLIKPPIEVISHVNKRLGPNIDPKYAYEKYMHRIGSDDHPDDVDPLFEEDTSLYLRIAPWANLTEIKTFIDKYYVSEMWPHLQTQPIWDTKHSKYLNNRKSKTRQSVGDNEPIKQRILALNAEGKRSPAIADVISSEYKKYIDQSYIRKIISDAKKV